MGTIGLPQEGTSAVIRFFGGSGYNGLKEQMAAAEIHIRTSNSNVNSEGFAFSAYAFRTGWLAPMEKVKILPNAPGGAATAYDIYLYYGPYIGFSMYEVVSVGGQWTGLEQTSTDPGTAAYDVPFQYSVFNDVNLGNALYVNYSNGNVGIGTAAGTSSKLSVKGEIKATKVRVTTSDWPDYVFAKDFQLRSISDLAGYIAANQHLPEMPAAEKVEKEGIDVGEMNKLLLKKIEEMSLYIIQLDKRVKELEAEKK
ncbi:hypothetical protein [Chitinophaga sp. sic0106]|uniref:hypothetical protein n=1 Tax=Chitinophaga sp. sic0106 TaxID=2854785 RepID=UPI001C474EBD|nr:hypothetical protein [Chitinophaga sp. sic0106]MBV7531178.1 hypothetical protein [Chitinophaga sp. sic0106]